MKHSNRILTRLMTWQMLGKNKFILLGQLKKMECFKL